MARHPSTAVAALVATAALAAGCGHAGRAATGGDPAAVTPAGATAFLSVTVRPQGALRDAAQHVLSRLLRTDHPGDLLAHAFDGLVSDDHLSYERDLRPWLGSRVGGYVAPDPRSPEPRYAILLSTTDGAKALATLTRGAISRGEHVARGRVDGVAYERDDRGHAVAVVGGVLVAAKDLPTLSASITARRSGSLAASAAFRRATGRVTRDGLALAYVDPGGLLGLLARAEPGFPSSLPLGPHQPFALALTATRDSLGLEFPVSRDSRATPLIAALPADAWLAVGIKGLGAGLARGAAGLLRALGPVSAEIQRAVRHATGLDLRRDILSWPQDLTLYAGGPSLLTGSAAALLSSRDPAASARAVAILGRTLRAHGTPVHRISVPGGAGFGLGSGVGPGFQVQASGGRVIGAYGSGGPNAILHPAATLGASATFRSAAALLGDGGRPALIFSMPAALPFIRSIPGTEGPGFAKVLPYLERIGELVVGTARHDGRPLARIVLGVR